MPSLYRLQNSVNAAYGPALNGVEVFICTQPVTSAAGVIPPTPLASLFTDSTGDTALANPVITDGLGNWFAYLVPGVYTVILYDTLNRIPITTFPDQEVVSPGGGTVTSVALKGDGVLFTTAIVGSPITTNGILDLSQSLQTVNANTFLAGPPSGSAGPWENRALVAADLPAGVGTVSSVAFTFTPSALFTSSLSGSPITGAGTIALTLGLANQAANLFLAGPASGGSGAVTARTITAADIFGIVPVAFSATPTFNAAAFAHPLFTMTLTGNVTSSTVSNPTNGQHITFELTQDATGSRTFAWPSNFHGSSDIDLNANSVSVQEFVYDGTFWRGVSPGQCNAT